MDARRALAHEQHLADLAVRAAGRDEAQDLDLARRQVVGREAVGDSCRPWRAPPALPRP